MFEKELVRNHKSVEIKKMKNFCDDPEQIGNKEGWVGWCIQTVEWQVKRNKVNYEKEADQKVESYFYPDLPRKLGQANVWGRLGEKIGAHQGKNSCWKKAEERQSKTVAEIFRFFIPNVHVALIANYLDSKII